MEKHVDLVKQNLSYVRWVKIWIGCSESRDEDLCKIKPSHEILVCKDDIQSLFDSFYRLHCEPGINPHGRHKCTPLRRFTVSKIVLRGPCWWTTPNLGVSNSDDLRPGVSFLSQSVCDKEEVLYPTWSIRLKRNKKPSLDLFRRGLFFLSFAH